jgi:hypothetical protein
MAYSHLSLAAKSPEYLKGLKGSYHSHIDGGTQIIICGYAAKTISGIIHSDFQKGL